MRDIFDIRNVIAALLGIFGIILLGVALLGTNADGSGVNLWTGLALVVAAILFAGWAWTRPVKPPHERNKH